MLLFNNKQLTLYVCLFKFLTYYFANVDQSIKYMNQQVNKSLAIVILAAGAATRFGSAKQLAIYKSKTLLQQKIDICCEFNEFDTYVVLGAAYQDIIKSTEFKTSKIIYNTAWKSGMASSIIIATQKLAKHYDSIMFLAADQVLIEHFQLTELIQSWQNQPTKLITAKFDNEITIPSIFPKEYYKDLLGLEGDKGGKKVLITHKENLIIIEMPEAKFDIDRPEDLSNLSSNH